MNDFIMTSFGHLALASQEGTNCGQSALRVAVFRDGKFALVDWVNINSGVVHVVFRDLQ